MRPFPKYRVISAHRRNKNLKDMLVRAKLPEQSGRIELVKSNHNSLYITPMDEPEHPFYTRWHWTWKTLFIVFYVKNVHVRLKQHIYSVGENRLNSPLVLHFQIHRLQYWNITGLQACAMWTCLLLCFHSCFIPVRSTDFNAEFADSCICIYPIFKPLALGKEKIGNNLKYNRSSCL